jgi:hypothetical protein
VIETNISCTAMGNYTSIDVHHPACLWTRVINFVTASFNPSTSWMAAYATYTLLRKTMVWYVMIPTSTCSGAACKENWKDQRIYNEQHLCKALRGPFSHHILSEATRINKEIGQ